MAIVSEYTTKGTSGWEVFFYPEGEVAVAKGDRAHHFPDADSVRYFLLGYEVATGECGGCDCVDMPHDDFMSELRSELVDCCEDSSGSNLATLIFDIDTSALELAAVKMAELADAAERAANAAERLEGALK